MRMHDALTISGLTKTYIVLAISFVCFAVSYKITTAVYRKQDII